MNNTSEIDMGPNIINIEKITESAQNIFSAKFPDEESLAKLPDNDDINHYWYEIPEKTRARYWGHGIDKGDDLQQLTAVMSIAETKFICGTTSTFKPHNWIQPYLSGNALVLSKIDNKLLAKEPQFATLNDGSSEKRGMKAEIGAIVLNNHLYPFAHQLKTQFPEVTIIKASDIVGHVQSEINNPEK